MHGAKETLGVGFCEHIVYQLLLIGCKMLGNWILET